jgi:hypothetical protein
VDFDHRLAVAVSKLRDALRDSAENPKFIETVGRRGYRLMVAVEWVDPVPQNGGPATEARASGPETDNLPQGFNKIAAPHLSLRSKHKQRLILFAVVFWTSAHLHFHFCEVHSSAPSQISSARKAQEFGDSSPAKSQAGS